MQKTFAYCLKTTFLSTQFYIFIGIIQKIKEKRS